MIRKDGQTVLQLMGHSAPEHRAPGSNTEQDRLAIHKNYNKYSPCHDKSDTLKLDGEFLSFLFILLCASTDLYRSCAALAHLSGTFDLILFETVNFEFIVETVWFV